VVSTDGVPAGGADGVVLADAPRAESVCRVDGARVAYAVRESDRASRARINVDLRGIEVVLPAGASVDPGALLRRNAAWVREQAAALADRRERVPDRTIAPGETVPVLGTERELVVESRQASALTEDAIRLRRSAVVQSDLETALRNVYRREARTFFEDRAALYAEAMDAAFDAVHIRNQRTRWGSCSTSGTLSFNWRLLLAPRAVADYVAVHEVAHLHEPNHDAAFWDLVGRHDPDYRAHRDWLADHRPELVLTEADL
jgi:predicted metal-dependent hydrolase